MSEKIIKLVRETFLRNVIFIGLVSLVLLVFESRLSLIAGLLLGSAVAMLNFFVIAWNTEQIMDKQDSFIFSYGLFYIARIVLSAICIYVGIRFSEVNLFTIVLGLFSIRISMTFVTFVEVFSDSFFKRHI